MKLLSFLPLAIGVLPLVASVPLTKRALSASDQSVLELALYLEHLEHAMYSSGFQNFTEQQYESAGFPPGFRDNVGVIASHEQTHIDLLTTVLTSNGITPIPTCQYKFPFTDPKSFAALANMVSTVGIGAYIGGATGFSDNEQLLTAAGSILAVEARHDAYVRTEIGASPFPTAFDTALTPVFAYNLAQMFIVSCPQPLPIIVLPKLNLTSPMPPQNLQPPVAAGTTLSFAWDPSKFFVSVDPNAPLYIALINQDVQAPIFQEVTKTGSGTGTVPLPANITGVAFAVLTTFSGGLTEAQLTQYGTLAGPAEVAVS
ncbi:hypothetical protein L228DRAFT_270974 [Xylona heveae TC161]|uniref:Uncharacterized protein n=1 Tax=Xylona heveae (strain CBS 132557 / TC161) TaxID=1328760 RepID=A0A164ZX89_XYLHT|nr:hypothetical protein L228DRAFT_270974 [Xylona heveae TC161]KZF19652.1 hypothetical protein L228DRAFT_270974 [Xylona heveae TC161]